MKLIISVDTECDKDSNWAVRQPLSFHNIESTIGFKEVLIRKFENAKITLLLSPEVIQNDFSVIQLKNQSNIELGTHMHLEFLMHKSEDVIKTEKVQSELTPEMDEFYINELTRLFIEKFGYKPKSFRAGRYGYNSKSTFSALKNLGYKVDSSIAPKSVFKFNEGIIVDNVNFNIYPFKFSNGLNEVPISIVNHGNPYLYNLTSKLPSYRLRNFFKFLKPKQIWIRPSYEDLDSLIANTKLIIGKWNQKKYGEPIINMMFHSNELYPEASPYNKSWEDVEIFKTKIIQYIEWLNENCKLEFCYLSDIEVKA
jgi:hypothetical protein